MTSQDPNLGGIATDESLNSLANNKNYVVIAFNGEQISKGLIDTGNSITEKVPISSHLHEILDVD